MEASQKSIPKIFQYGNKLFDLMALLSTMAIFFVVIIQVAGRLIGNPEPWTEEATRFIFIWMIFLGIGLGFRRAESARVTIFIEWMPAVLKKVATVIYSAGTIGFFLFMFYTGIELMMQQFTMHEMGSALMIPMWIIGLSIPVSALVGIIGVIESILFHRDLLKVGS